MSKKRKVDFIFDDRSVLRCPGCKNPLKVVRQDGERMFNDDQFDAIKAGDFYCDKCPTNERCHSGFRYFWKRDLGIV